MNPLLSDLLSSLDQTPRPIDRDLITKAWEFANLAHTSQKRLSGEPYIIHPTQVAKTLSLWNMDTTTIVAGLLHDTIEDGGAKREDLVKEFGEEVALIVDGVTKVTDIRLKGSSQEDFVENLRKMILVMARDLRVVMVKLADRLHNMQTSQYLPPEKQVENAKETLEIYAPLADRLGMGELKGQLEDLSFPYVYPEEYKTLINQTKKIFAESEKYIEKFKRELLSILIPQIPGVVINIRHKHLYSLWRKLERPDHAGDLTKIHDLVAARVLVSSVEDCYTALGLIHTRFHPVPYLGIRDFIANPKPNGYRSIHTNVFGPEGRIVEIQIRTFAMHDQAEHGIVAHWQYSQTKSKSVSSEVLATIQVSEKLSWVKQLASWQKEITDNQEYLQTLKFDALQHRNLVFSPIGDVYDLPYGATPIDYAYAVHTDLGHQANGAKVNGKMVPLSHKLVNGDVVEIIIDRKRAKPSHEWLDFVVTTTARHQIQKALKT
ncbi:hypothetical protein A2810_00060 [candidate division Kazan bacterium RIFCSPHIGHO2_01_FULL_49_10]|nr:MAG: hypothetical protein A2810_00060 [candidate division Kazan bacterium RIFCSPHIGHO2_01_FULL_49_10]